MPPWLFDVYIDGCMREMEAKVVELDTSLKTRGKESFVAGVFAEDTVLLAEDERMLLSMVGKVDRVGKRREVRVNAEKGKIMVFERARERVFDYSTPY